MSTWCEKCALEFPALTLLAGEFLHEDWPDEYEDVDEAVEAFAACQPELAVRLGDEVEELLARRLSEDQLADLLVVHLGLGQWPEGPYVPYEVWLRRAADTAAQVAATQL
jgi:hypothetical protein